MAVTVAAHYEILEQVGEGGWGVVYKARDLHVPRFVALKFIYPHLLSSPEARQRLQQEARAVSALSHPNIVVLHDFDTDPETRRIFLVLEYLGGGTLRQLIERTSQHGQPLPPAELLRYATAIAAGLGHAHRHGIIHRDVKPSNIMFSEERTIKITDFGLAKSSAAADITQSGCAPGTLSYMSPEQLRGLPVDHRSDIFSYGVLLYEMIAGQLPFAGSTLYETQQKIVAEPTPPLRHELDRIIQRATAKQPSDRYRDMEEVETELLAIHRRLAARSEQPTAALAVSRSRSLRRRTPALLLLALLAIAFSVLWHRARRGAAAPPPPARLMAVIPFHCIGAGESQQAFCEGLANTLSTKFTQMEPLQDRILVVPYSEIRRQGVESAAEANKLFKAQLALTGSVQFMDQNVRVIVNLVDAEKKLQTASRKLDSSSGSLVRLQDETSELAGNMLAVRLHAADRQRLNAGQTPSEAAFDSFVRGVGYLSRGDGIENVRAATGLLQEAIRMDPRYALAHAHLGEAYLLQYRKTEDNVWIGRARASCEQALKIDGRLAQAHLSMAKVLQARTEPEKAIAELRLALRIEPKNADALRALGNAYADLGIRKRDPARKQEAIDTFREAIEIRPELWTTYRDLGLAYLRMGEKQQAEQQYLRMIELTAGPDAYTQLGALYHLMDRSDEAVACFRKSLAIRPTPDAYANLGTVYYYLGRYADVIPNYEAALRLSEEARTGKHIIWGNLAGAYARTPGMEAKARAAYAEAIRIAKARLETSPHHAETHASLAYYLVRTGDRRGALRHARRAVELAPDVAAVLFRSGVVYEKLNRRADALAAIRQAIAKGHPVKEVLHAGDLAALRQDSRFAEIMKGATPNGSLQH